VRSPLDPWATTGHERGLAGEAEQPLHATSRTPFASVVTVADEIYERVVGKADRRAANMFEPSW
jgi:hypothetical protein